MFLRTSANSSAIPPPLQFTLPARIFAVSIRKKSAVLRNIHRQLGAAWRGATFLGLRPAVWLLVGLGADPAAGSGISGRSRRSAQRRILVGIRRAPMPTRTLAHRGDASRRALFPWKVEGNTPGKLLGTRFLFPDRCLGDLLPISRRSRNSESNRSRLRCPYG